MEKLPNKGATWKFDEFSGEEEISTKSTASKLLQNDILLTHYMLSAYMAPSIIR